MALCQERKCPVGIFVVDGLVTQTQLEEVIKSPKGIGSAFRCSINQTGP